MRIHALALGAMLLSAAALAGCDKPAERESTPTTTQPAAVQPAGPGDGMMTVELELPPPAFKGTPKNIPPGSKMKLRPPGEKRPPLVVPAGATNMARGRPVTASDNEPVIGELAFVTDGHKGAEEGRFVELGFGPQWVQIDLGKPAEVWAVVVWHEHGDPRVYRDVIVQVSSDADFIDATTVFNNDHDNSSGMGVGEDFEYFETYEGRIMNVRSADGKPVRGRYVRLYANGSTGDMFNRYTEVEVYAVPAGE